MIHFRPLQFSSENNTLVMKPSKSINSSIWSNLQLILKAWIGQNIMYTFRLKVPSCEFCVILLSSITLIASAIWRKTETFPTQVLSLDTDVRLRTKKHSASLIQSPLTCVCVTCWNDAHPWVWTWCCCCFCLSWYYSHESAASDLRLLQRQQRAK